METYQTPKEVMENHRNFLQDIGGKVSKTVQSMEDSSLEFLCDSQKIIDTQTHSDSEEYMMKVGKGNVNLRSQLF